MLTVDSVWLYRTNPATKAREGGLRPGWRGALRATLAAAMPLVLRGGIRAFFLGGERLKTRGARC